MAKIREVPYPEVEGSQFAPFVDQWFLNRYDEDYLQVAEERIKALEDAGGGGVATGSILDLKGTPGFFPTIEQCVDTDWMVLVKSDGIYFRNPLTCEELKPKAFSLRAPAGGSATHFLHLQDTPSAYTNHAGKLLKVSDHERGIEFVDMPDHTCQVTTAQYMAVLKRLEALEAGGVTPSCTCDIDLTATSELFRRVERMEEYYGVPSKLRIKAVSRSSGGCTGMTLSEAEDLDNRVTRLRDYYGVDISYTPPTPNSTCGGITTAQYQSVLDGLDRLEDYWGV